LAIGIDVVLQEIPGGWDLKIGPDGDFESADSLDTYIVVALFSDARADESEIAEPKRRRGWIGNEETPGFELGSKVWLYEQSRLTGSSIRGVEFEARNALRSMVGEGIAVAIGSATVSVEGEGATLEVPIQRTPDVVERRYFELWNNTGAR